jgi:Sulfotransferase family
MEPAPFFIVGCGRSGTTLLRRTFNAHPDVAVPMESQFIDQLADRWDLFAPSGRLDTELLFHELDRHLRRMQIDEGRARARVGALVNPGVTDVVGAIFRVYADAEGKARWGDATHGYVQSMPLLARVWPEAKFVHVIRDGRDVALGDLHESDGPTTVPDAAQEWNRRVSVGRRHGGVLGPPRYVEVRHEDILEDPRAQLTVLCDFLGLAFDPAMLEFQGEDEAGDEWRTAMPESLVRRFESAAGTLLGDLGYERRYPDPNVAARSRAFTDARIYDAKALLARARRRRASRRDPDI